MPARRSAVVAVLTALSTAAFATAQSSYTIRKLTCPGLDHGVAWDIDNAGNIVGEMLDANGVAQPVVWRNGVGEALKLLTGGNSGAAYTISEGEFIGGTSSAAASSTAAAVWLPSSGARTAVNLGVGSSGFAASVLGVANDVAVGFIDDGIFATPAIWRDVSETATFAELPLPPWAVAGEATAITASGLVVGFAADFGSSKPVYWDISGVVPTVTVLPTLAGWGRVGDVNSSGLAVGAAASAATGHVHLATWQNGVITDEGHLPGMDCFGEAINEFGDVAGWARTFANPPYVGIVKLAGSPIQNLNDLLPAQSGWTAVRAHGINNDGHIVGSGVIDGYFEPFVMVPTQVLLAQPVPGFAGVRNTFAVAGVTPSATVYYAVSLLPGETLIPGCRVGFDLALPLIFATSVADANGDSAFAVPVPLGLGQIPFLLQAYDHVGCATSNVVSVTF